MNKRSKGTGASETKQYMTLQFSDVVAFELQPRRKGQWEENQMHSTVKYQVL